MTGLAAFHDPTHPNALLAPVRFLDDQSCTRYTPPGHIESCFASSMMPHQDPESVPYVQAQRESRGWWRGLDFLALHSPTGQGPGDAISPAHLPRPVLRSLLAASPSDRSKWKAMLPGGRSRARTVHASSHVRTALVQFALVHGDGSELRRFALLRDVPLSRSCMALGFRFRQKKNTRRIA